MDEEKKASALVGTTSDMDKRIKKAAETAHTDASLGVAGINPADSTAEKSVELKTEMLRAQSREAQAKAPEIEAQKAAAAAADREAGHAEMKEALHHDTVIKPLRTYRGDVEEIMNREKASVLTIKMAEDKRETEKAVIGEEQHSISKEAASISTKAVSLILSAILVTVGVALLIAFQINRQSGPLTGEKNDAIIPYESEEEIALSAATRDEVIAIFVRTRALAPRHEGAVLDIKFAKEAAGEKVPATSADLLALLGAQAPQTLVRAFGDEFMAGTFGTSRSEPFLIFKVASFDNAFSGMLAWEETMAADLGPLFTEDRIVSETGQTVYVQSPGAASTTATSTASGGTRATSTAPVAPAAVTYTDIGKKKPTRFEDLVVNNIDTRIARNESRQTVLIYSFIDKETLVVTTNETALNGIIDKYRASKLIR